MNEETHAIVNGWGKWGAAGVPHKGWECIGERDALEDYGDLITCEMCERTQVRFIQVMQNDRYNGVLECGCICAGHMSGEMAQAEDRDKRLRSRASRRSKFANRKGWKVSVNGTPYILVNGFHIVIALKAGGNFQIGIKKSGDSRHRWGRKRHASMDVAKTACFDALEYFTNQQP